MIFQSQRCLWVRQQALEKWVFSHTWTGIRRWCLFSISSLLNRKQAHLISFKNCIMNWRYTAQSQHYCLTPESFKPPLTYDLIVLWVSATVAFSQMLKQSLRLFPKRFSFLACPSPASLSHASHLRPLSLLHRSCNSQTPSDSVIISFPMTEFFSFWSVVSLVHLYV